MAISMIGNIGAPPPRPEPRVEGKPVTVDRPPPAPEAVEASASLPERPTPEKVQQAIESVRRLVDSKSPNSLQFSVDEATGKTVVKITDATTGETIRQIPAEELLRIARSLDKLQGMLLRQEA